jgi:hypothetical protein
MPSSTSYLASDFDTHFKIFHELMSNKVFEILLVASPYDAYILEEDGSLASKIINEYRGLNLSRPPRIERVSSAGKALARLGRKAFDLVVVMPHLEDMDPVALGLTIKEQRSNLPVILLSPSAQGLALEGEEGRPPGIDQTFIWTGDSDLLLAIVKSVEDQLNVARDTATAKVRVLLLVEDSPLYKSFFLPLIYREVVNQTQEVIEESLNEEHRLLKMRARPKILVAETFEGAIALFEKYKEFIFGVISDTRFPKKGQINDEAGYLLLTHFKEQIPDLPLLLLSTEPKNHAKAAKVPAEFLDKNSPNLFSEIHDFFLDFLGFGDFIFRTPDGNEVGRASNLRSLEEILPHIPDEPLCYHANRNRFSNWIMARSEITLASKFREVSVDDFPDIQSMRSYIISGIHALRKWRQKGVVAQFNPQDFDPDISDFLKIGKGSLGGKARGLAFVSNMLRQHPEFYEKYAGIEILVPKILVITADWFDTFIETNHLGELAKLNLPDEEISKHFLEAHLPDLLGADLKAFLAKEDHPLSVRSSSLLEDAHYHPFSGLYKTFMIPNNHPDLTLRLQHLITAIKLVYASTYFKDPKTFSSSTSSQLRKEHMAVMVQRVAGRSYGDYFYPDISGIAQSRNFYPVAHLRPDDGVARIALGFGKAASEKRGALRFSPRYPKYTPQFSKVEDILSNAQRHFYALRIKDYPDSLYFDRGINIERREVADCFDDFAIQTLSATYIPEENRIRDTAHIPGPKILNFAQVLKYDRFPLAPLLSDLLDLGRKGMGCPVEFEFCVNLNREPSQKSEFFILQMRPMAAGEAHFEVEIGDGEITRAFCYSTQALGHGNIYHIRDIVFVEPEAFDPGATPKIAEEIGKINSSLFARNKPYLLVGPGRWGSFDRWLGIPVKWHDISGAGAIIELRNEKLKADPSHGSHFFQHITAKGMPYITITEGETGFVKWDRLKSFAKVQATFFLRHVCLDQPFTIKCDGKSSRCVMYEDA